MFLHNVLLFINLYILFLSLNLSASIDIPETHGISITSSNKVEVTITEKPYTDKKMKVATITLDFNLSCIAYKATCSFPVTGDERYSFPHNEKVIVYPKSEVHINPNIYTYNEDNPLCCIYEYSDNYITNTIHGELIKGIHVPVGKRYKRCCMVKGSATSTPGNIISADCPKFVTNVIPYPQNPEKESTKDFYACSKDTPTYWKYRNNLCSACEGICLKKKCCNDDKSKEILIPNSPKPTESTGCNPICKEEEKCWKIQVRAKRKEIHCPCDCSSNKEVKNKDLINYLLSGTCKD